MDSYKKRAFLRIRVMIPVQMSRLFVSYISSSAGANGFCFIIGNMIIRIRDDKFCDIFRRLVHH